MKSRMKLGIVLIGIGAFCGVVVGQTLPVGLPERVLEEGRAQRDLQAVLLAGVGR